jgi:hypothetical protein
VFRIPIASIFFLKLFKNIFQLKNISFCSNVFRYTNIKNKNNKKNYFNIFSNKPQNQTVPVQISEHLRPTNIVCSAEKEQPGNSTKRHWQKKTSQSRA